MRETKSMRIMLLSVLVVIIVAVPITYIEYSSHNTPRLQISVQTFNSTYTYIVNKTLICYPTYYEYLQNVTSNVVVSENGSNSSSISLRVWGGSAVITGAPMGLITCIFVCINGSLASTLRPSGLTILQGIQTPPNVPECVSGSLFSQYTNNTNILLAKYDSDGPGFYSNNASGMASMDINESFVNETTASNITAYHFRSFLFFYLKVGPCPQESGNWSTVANLFPLNYTTALTITGLSRPVQEQIVITIPRVTGGS